MAEMKNLIHYLVTLIILLYSCQKPNERKCFKGWGEESEISIELNDFDSLDVNHNMIVHLYQDTVNKIKIRGGKNVIEWITVENSNNKLILSDANTCKFLRSFKKKIHIDLHYKHLNHIRYTGGEKIVMENTLKSSELRINFIDGGGTIHCNVDLYYFEINVTGGAGNFYAQGKSKIAYYKVLSNGFGDAKDLVADTLILYNKSSGDLIGTVNDGGQVVATILYSGNNQIYGTSSKTTLKDEGEGENIFH